MLLSCARKISVSLRQTAPALLGLLTLAALPLQAQTSLPPVTVGAGLQTSFVHTEPDGPDNNTDQFLVNSARIYLGGSATEKIKFMFNTEYDGVTNKIGVLDAAAKIALDPKFNIWMGRMLPPSDRANLYGPYYAHHWATFSDGIQNGHPFVAAGRDNGVLWWGDFSKVKLSAGAYDGLSATGKKDVIGAGRIQVDFWDKEDGYYLNGTYYGDKNLLALAGATQIKDGEAKFFRGKSFANTGYVWKTTEIDFNYVIKQFNARVMFFFKNNNYTAIKTDNWQGGVGLQIQM